MTRYLIVNADDYGMCHAANQAVQELFDGGYLKSSTIMTPCPAAEEAVAYAAAHPEHAIGVHLTLTSEWETYRWTSLTGGKTLADEEGYMWRQRVPVEKNASYQDIEAEVRAQVQFARSRGLEPSHLDNHMGTLYGHYTGRFGLLKLALRLCGEYGLSYRMFTDCTPSTCPQGIPLPLCKALSWLARFWARRYRVILPDYLLMPDWQDDMRTDYETYREKLLATWAAIPEGITETFVHPSVECDELKSITVHWRDRVWEYQLMKDPYTHAFLKEHDIELISHRELRAMKSARK